MRKNKQETTSYSPQQDTGAYHTGAARPPRRRNALVMILLMAVIFLGGMASALGIVNFHLLSLQNQRGDPMTPVNSAGNSTVTDPTAFLNTNDDPAPVVPSDRNLQLALSDAGQNMSAPEIYAHNERSLLSVYSTTHGNETLSGTGMVLHSDGYILTNAHLVESAKRIFVYLPDGRLLRAAVVGSDPFTDLAVLYVQARDLTAALLTGAAALQPNETVYALKDQPDADDHLILSGTVCSLQTVSTGTLEIATLRTELIGDSGPVFDSKGQIVAIQANKIRRYFSDEVCGSAGIAIPAETVIRVVEELVEKGRIQGRPALGIQVEAISKLYQYYWDLPGGLLVTILDENCSACQHGLQDGDILLTLDGVQLSSQADLYATLYSASVGDQLTACVFRDGRKFNLTLSVEENTQP